MNKDGGVIIWDQRNGTVRVRAELLGSKDEREFDTLIAAWSYARELLAKQFQDATREVSA